MGQSAGIPLTDCYAAVDIGASSGRVVVGYLEDGLIRLEEVHRFDNRQVRLNGHDCWDLDLLGTELLRGLARCREAGFAPKTVGIDTWGVDFVLLDADDNLVGDAVAYRDARTNGMYEVADAIMAPEELYRHCGLQRQPFNTIYQLLALQREHPEQLEAADTFLMIPDYLNFLLTGQKAVEYTNASTTGLLNAETGAWDETVMAAFAIPRRLFPNVTHAGASLGPVLPEVASSSASSRWSAGPRPPSGTRPAWGCRPPTTPVARIWPCRPASRRRCSSRRAPGVCSAWRTAVPSVPSRPTARTSPTRADTISVTAS